MTCEGEAPAGIDHGAWRWWTPASSPPEGTSTPADNLTRGDFAIILAATLQHPPAPAATPPEPGPAP